MRCTGAFVGGRGSGKSYAISYDLIRRAKRGRLYLMASPTYTVLADTDFRTFCGIARDLGVLGAKRVSPPSVQLTTGAEIIFRSADDPERLRGPNLSGAVLNEASLMTKDAYDICIASLREGGEQGFLTAGFTPKGLTHWTYEVFGGEHPKPDTAIFHARTADNPFAPPGFADTLAQQYSGLMGQQELDGRFCSLEGAEWPPEFFEGIFFDDWPPDLNHKVLALDPSKGKADHSGDYSAFVSLALDSEWRLWCDADLDRRPVERQQGEPGRSIVEDGLALVKAWQPSAFSVETNGFQELVASALLRVGRERRVHLPLYGVNSVTPKDARIRAIGTYLGAAAAAGAEHAGGPPSGPAAA